MIPTRIGVTRNGNWFAGFIRAGNQIDSLWISPARLDDECQLVNHVHSLSQMEELDLAQFSTVDGVANTYALAPYSIMAFALSQIYTEEGSPKYHIPSLVEFVLCTRSFHSSIRGSKKYKDYKRSEIIEVDVTHDNSLIPRVCRYGHFMSTPCLPFQAHGKERLLSSEAYWTSTYINELRMRTVIPRSQHLNWSNISESVVRLRLVRRDVEVRLQ